MNAFNEIATVSPQERVRREIPLLGATDDEVESLYALSLRETERVERDLGQLQTYCTFIGYPRSGHSILGSLLDAHPHVIIAHELDAVRFVEAGFSERQLYYLLIENSRQFTQCGRSWGSYCYAVPGQWQGRYSELKVIGDNKGGLTTTRIGRNWDLLDRLCGTIHLDHRFVHVIRNPFDNIATLAVRQTKDILQAIAQYFFMCDTNRKIRQQFTTQVMDLYHEEFITDPKLWLGRLFDFVNISTHEAFLKACADIVYRLPHKSRFEIRWPAGSIELINRERERHEFLRRYSFDD